MLISLHLFLFWCHKRTALLWIWGFAAFFSGAKETINIDDIFEEAPLGICLQLAGTLLLNFTFTQRCCLLLWLNRSLALSLQLLRHSLSTFYECHCIQFLIGFYLNFLGRCYFSLNLLFDWWSAFHCFNKGVIAKTEENKHRMLAF